MDVNLRVADRSNVFYWQTDRRITPSEAGKIWADRTKGFSDKLIINNVNEVLKADKLTVLDGFNPDSQTNLGNVNYVRTGRMASGKEVVIRCFPIGIKNGYFHSESAASAKAKKARLPAYRTYAVHDMKSKHDFAFQVCEKLPGTIVARWIEKNPEDEKRIIFEIGRLLARVNQIPVKFFGPFNNDLAKKGILKGLHKTFASALQANIDVNLLTLKDYKILDQKQLKSSRELFTKSNSITKCDGPVLVHNDFADWNLLTDGKKITGILDWDECVGGDFISDIACWSTFFEPERLEGMLKGYWSARDKPDGFEERFQLLRFRYTISKMALRIRRYTWESSDSMRNKIEIGKTHLAASLRYFGID